MGWWALIRIALVFGLLYVAVPFWVHHRSHRRSGWTADAAESFGWLCFVLQVSISVLGKIHLALPGAVTTIYSAWVLANLLRHRAHVAFEGRTWVTSAARLLTYAEHFRIQDCTRRFLKLVTSSRAAWVLSWLVLLLAFLVVQAWFPVYNLRFMTPDGYSQSLSLATISSGQDWPLNLSVPVLVPLGFWSGLSASRVVALSGPLFALVFVLATAFVAFELTGSRLTACLAAGLSAAAPICSPAAGGSEMASAALGMTAFGLMLRRPVSALCTGMTALSMPASAQVWSALAAAAGCVILAAFAIRCARFFPRRIFPVIAPIPAVVLTAALCFHFPYSPPDGPLQYEAAARVCDQLAQSLAHNSWLVISPPQELPFTYGRGWHMELSQLVSDLSIEQVGDPAFHFPYQAHDIFFFIESQPLWAGGSDAARITRASVESARSLDPAVISYVQPLGRTALEFRAAELLSAYGRAHAGVETIYADGRLSVYHVKGWSPQIPRNVLPSQEPRVTPSGGTWSVLLSRLPK